MNPLQSQPTVALALKAVKHDIESGEMRQVPVYLHFSQQDGKLRPIKLGTGRSAVVLLATEYGSIRAQAEYYAVKFLREDPDPQYSEASAQRFFTEAQQMQLWGRGGGYLVNYVGWGAIAKDLTRPDTRGGVKEFWWNSEKFGRYDPEQISDEERASGERPILDNNGDVFRQLKHVLKLQGPFYIMNLCQGTLEDLLEGSEPWSQLAVYQWIDRYKQGLDTTRAKVKKDVEWFYKYYLDPSKSKASGYDILNSFYTQPTVKIPIGSGEVSPTRIRNHAVLQLFREIAGAVDNLHQGTEADLHPLAHRDIKPGNIFLQHPFDRLTEISIRLSDLGYVSSLQALGQGQNARYQALGDTHVFNRHGTAYQAPGSQFYRAPEQAELPIEVRVDVDPERRNLVRVKGAKLSGIEPNDWLLIDDLQEDPLSNAFRISDTGQIEAIEAARGPATVFQLPDEPEPAESSSAMMVSPIQPVFTILQVRQNEQNADIYELVLDAEVLGDELRDLHAQITKATGFHTDGYSLGAILYDLASGGKNPEHFFTYCLRVFTTEFTRRKVDENYNSVDLITDVLCPKQEEGKTTDSVFGRSAPRQTKSYNFKRPTPQETKSPMPNGSVARLFATGMWHKGADHYLDQAVALIYPPVAQDAELTWGDIWRKAREAQADDADAILKELADLLYRGQPVENETTWERIWQIVRAARSAASADEFLDQAVRILYDGDNTSEPEEESIWHLVKQAQGGINADAFLDRVVKSIYMDRPEERDRRIRNLQFRKFHVVEDLLKDKRGEPIHREIIRLIVSCMMRGIKGAFYQLHPQHGYNSLENTRAVATVRDEVDRLLLTDFDLEEGSVPASLRENILFGLRCLSDDALRSAQPAAELLMPIPEATAEPSALILAVSETAAPVPCSNGHEIEESLPDVPQPSDEQAPQ